MRGNLCDRVLDYLHPAFAVTLLVLVVEERYDLVLKQTVDSGSVELVLIALVQVCALLGECPSGTLAIALKPPSVEH